MHIKIGQFTVPAEERFLYIPEDEIIDGEYIMLLKLLNDEGEVIDESLPVEIEINTALDFGAPKAEKIADKAIDEKVLKLEVRLQIIDQKPVLIGTTDTGSRVVALWESLVMASSLIVDTESGVFRTQSPQALSEGEHRVTVYAIRDEDGARSETIIIPFEIKPPAYHAALEPVAGYYQWYIMGGIALGLALIVAILIHRRRRRLNT